MRREIYIKTGIFMSLLLLLCGCSAYGSYKPYAAQDNEVAVPARWSTANPYIHSVFSNQLLALVDHPSVARLVEQTLAANYDLRRTAIRLQEAQLVQYQAGLQGRPALDAKFESQRTKQLTTASEQTLSMDISWELDVWGRLADARHATAASTWASELDLQAARNSLAARVIQAWLDISYRRQIIALEQQWIANLVNSEHIIQEQILNGTKEPSDLDTARAETAKARVSLAARQHSQSKAIRSLNVLRGRTDTKQESTLIDLPRIAAPPAQLPGEVLGARPDLLAAYQRIVAADKQTAMAYKALLPKFTLTGSVSYSETSMHQLLEGSPLWKLLGGITAPLFDRGKITSEAQIAELKAERLYLAYQNQLLTAITEVENAMEQEASLRKQQTYQQHAFDLYQSSIRNNQARYQDGTIGILDYLEAKRAVFKTHIQLLETQQARFSNRITLGLALGMGV